MSKNRKKTTNVIEVGAMAKWIALFCLIGVISLAYVHIMTLHHTYGEERDELDKHLGALRQRDSVVSAHIVRWSSRAMLKRRLDEGFISLSPIADDRIVRLQSTPTGFPVAELRAVSNQVSYE